MLQTTHIRTQAGLMSGTAAADPVVWCMKFCRRRPVPHPHICTAEVGDDIWEASPSIPAPAGQRKARAVPADIYKVPLQPLRI